MLYGTPGLAQVPQDCALQSILDDWQADCVTDALGKFCVCGGMCCLICLGSLSTGSIGGMPVQNSKLGP